MFDSVRALYAELAQALGVTELPADDAGGLQLMVGESASIVIFAEAADTLLVAAPVMALPAAVDYGRALWLLQRNYYASPIAPFRVSCDANGNLVVWSRVPVAGMTGEALAKLIDALGAEVGVIREEVAVEEPASD